MVRLAERLKLLARRMLDVRRRKATRVVLAAVALAVTLIFIAAIVGGGVGSR